MVAGVSWDALGQMEEGEQDSKGVQERVCPLGSFTFYLCQIMKHRTKGQYKAKALFLRVELLQLLPCHWSFITSVIPLT